MGLSKRQQWFIKGLKRFPNPSVSAKIAENKKYMKVAVESRVNDLIVSAELESGHSTRESSLQKLEISQKEAMFSTWGHPDANFLSLALEPEGIDSYVLPIYRYVRSSSLPVK